MTAVVRIRIGVARRQQNKSQSALRSRHHYDESVPYYRNANATAYYRFSSAKR